MQKNNKTITFLILCLISISVLHWCQSNQNSNITENNETIEQTITQEDNTQIQKLVINNWCIWCRKCAVIAPESFEMKWWVAIVSTQDHITEQSTQNAVSRCPVSVIKIIEA